MARDIRHQGAEVEIKTMADALRLADRWAAHAAELEREARALRADLAEALGDVKRLHELVAVLEVPKVT